MAIKSFGRVLTTALLSAVLPVLASIVRAEPPAGAVWSTDTVGQKSVRVAANMAYGYPDRNALDFDGGRITGWSDFHESLVWYGKLAHSGMIVPALTLRLPAGEKVTLRLTVTPGGEETPQTKAAQSVTVFAAGTGDTPVTVIFPALPMGKDAPAGWTRFTLTGLEKSGATFGDIEALTLSGSALADAFFNTTHYRSTASVHLGYPVPADIGPVDAFYNEVKARRDPVVTYYCAIGWSRGYMGYQVNGPHERRIIFSVWDAGNEKVNRDAVAQKDRAEWLERGPGVVTDRFGNEGTGGHSHMVYPWKNGETYRFLVTSQTDGPDHVIYAGYFYFPEKKAWGLIGKIRTPARKPGESASEAALHGLYSFDEDFSGAAGDRLRSAEFGPQWAHTSDGKWHEIIDARFTNTDKDHRQRDDYDALPTGNGRTFVLSTGGYVPPHAPIAHGDMLRRKAAGMVPEDLNRVLAHLPTGIPMTASAGGTQQSKL